jgi:toxin ParE1/3/4
MRLRWSPEAEIDFLAIVGHIAVDSETAATRQARLLLAATRQLELFPRSGRRTRTLRTRELVVPKTPYIIKYSIEEDVIILISIRHGAMLI